MNESRGCRVSVAIPCYNSARTVEAALDSALSQTLPDIEILAVDDGSTDGTRRLLDRYAEYHPEQVRVFKQTHAGPYVARNRAAAHARGAFLAFLDSDDFWEPRKLELQVELMEARPEVVLCHTGGRAVGPGGTGLRTFPAQLDYRGDCFLRLLVSNGVATSSVMVRRDLFLELGGFDEAFPARGDWEMWTRLAQRGPLAALDLPLIRYRFHEGRMSRDTDRMRRHHLAVIEKHARVYRADVPALDTYLRESRYAAYMAYGTEYLTAGRRIRAAAEALRALYRKPNALPPWKLLGKTFIGKRLAARLRGREVPERPGESAAARSASAQESGSTASPRPKSGVGDEAEALGADGARGPTAGDGEAPRTGEAEAPASKSG